MGISFHNCRGGADNNSQALGDILIPIHRVNSLYRVDILSGSRSSLFQDLITLGGREALRKKYLKYFYKSRDKIYPYKTTPPLLGAYGHFFDRIRHAVVSDDLEDEFAESVPLDDTEVESEGNGELPKELKLDALWQSLVEEFKVVEIQLEDGDDAQVIFETLNERGEPLLAADLVRNNIFHRAEGAGEAAEKLFAAHWKPFEEPFWSEDEKQGRYRKPRIEFFLANFIAGQIAGEVNLTKLFSEYKAFIKATEFETVGAELKEIQRYGAIYRRMIERNDGNKLGRFAKKLRPWDVTTVFPLVLRIWAEPDLSDSDKSAMLDILLVLIVRRAVCGLTTKNYNKFFLTVVGHLDGQGWSRERFVEFLLGQRAETARFPRDEEFENRWIEAPIYKTLQSSRCRALLQELEIAKRTRYNETSALAEHLTVEHVMPQKWQEHWLLEGAKPSSEDLLQAIYTSTEDESQLGRIVRRNRLVDTLGNLTLLTQPLNSAVSYGPFGAKRKALQEHSLLVMNREISQQEDWDEERIVERSRALFGLAKALWPLPDTLD